LFHLPVLRSSVEDPTLMDQAHVTEPLDADRHLFGSVPTVWLQRHLFTPGTVHWYDVAAVAVYLSHFVVSIAFAVVLWATAYPLFKRYVATLVTLTLAALGTYVLYPAAPPWMASLNGYLPAGVVRVVAVTLSASGVEQINSAVERGELYANSVAAMPSLHGAVPMMLLVFCWPLVRRRARGLLAFYVAAMAFTLVYAGEHYVTDVLVGWMYAGASVLGVQLIMRRREHA
jgi:membrane-associated phospholipid phosphatase